MEIDTSAMQAAMAKAMMDAVTPELQQQLFLKAVQSALFEVAEPNAGYGSPKRTVLQKVCEASLNDVMRQIVKEMLMEPGTQAILVAEVQKGVSQLVASGVVSEKVTDWLRSSIGQRF